MSNNALNLKNLLSYEASSKRLSMRQVDINKCEVEDILLHIALQV